MKISDVMDDDKTDPAEAVRQLVRDLRSVDRERRELKNKLADLDDKEERLRTALDVLEEYGAVPNEGDLEPDLASGDLSLTEAAEIVLERAGQPLNTGTIAREMKEGGYPYEGDVSKLVKSLRGVLSRGANDGTFVRVRRGMYGIPGRDEPEQNEEDVE